MRARGLLFMELLLKELSEFYEKLDQVLLPSGRDCGLCGECCKKASMLTVRPLEMENIKRYVQDGPRFKKFCDFAQSSVVKIWSITGHCPFQEGTLCGIYPVRPYCCRVYGHYDYLGKNLLEGCVYRGHATIYSRREELPLKEEFDRLTAAFDRIKPAL